MRSDIFYWKCDQLLSVESKKELYFADKYSNDSIAVAKSVVRDFLGKEPVEFNHLKVDGNHFAYYFSDSRVKFFLRTDDGLSDDCYMLAESAIMEELSKSKMPVPKVFATSVDLKKFPVRYQIMEFLETPSLNAFYQQNTLNCPDIAREFGVFLSRLHQHKYPKFGFIDINILSEEKQICGIDPTWAAYFNKCLPKHLGYLQDKQILSAGKIRQIEQIFECRQEWLNLDAGSLLHRDFAYWNILGTQDRISAVIDWDDAVIGDPADDLGIVNCFNAPEFMRIMLESYSSSTPVDENFTHRIWLYTLRNMLWKTMIRHYMGYFDRDKKFFLNKNELNLSLKEYSLEKINQSIKNLSAL